MRYTERRDAEDALDAMDGKEVNGREVTVQFAKFGRSDGPPRGRGGPRGGGRDRYSDRDYDDRRGGKASLLESFTLGGIRPTSIQVTWQVLAPRPA